VTDHADPADELRRLYPPILTTAHVAEMMHCTIGDVRDKVHRKELKAMRWGQQFRFFREEVIAALMPVDEEGESGSVDTIGES
jgi:excisionase family DNA binding protein